MTACTRMPSSGTFSTGSRRLIRHKRTPPPNELLSDDSTANEARPCLSDKTREGVCPKR
jgi:hypothetical protein